MTEGRFRRTRTIEADDIDQLGHVNNVSWLRFVIELADAHSTAAGFDLAAYREIGGLWIVRRHEIDYRGAAMVGDTVHEETWVSACKGARSIRCSRFTATDDKPLVTATTEWAYVDASTLRPRRVDPDVLAAFPIVQVAS